MRIWTKWGISRWRCDSWLCRGNFDGEYGQNFGLSAMTEEIYATFQIESIRSTRSSIRYILDGYAPRDEQEARIYGMKRGLEFIANRQNTITEENLHYLYQISTGDYAARAVILKDISPESEFRRDFLFFIVKAGSCSFAEMATH